MDGSLVGGELAIKCWVDWIKLIAQRYKVREKFNCIRLGCVGVYFVDAICNNNCISVLFGLFHRAPWWCCSLLQFALYTLFLHCWSFFRCKFGIVCNTFMLMFCKDFFVFLFNNVFNIQLIESVTRHASCIYNLLYFFERKYHFFKSYRGTYNKNELKIDEERGNTKVSINKLLLHWMKWQIMHHNHVNEWLYYDMLFFCWMTPVVSTLVAGETLKIINNWRRQYVINWVNLTAYVVFIGMWLHRII